VLVVVLAVVVGVELVVVVLVLVLVVVEVVVNRVAKIEAAMDGNRGLAFGGDGGGDIICSNMADSSGV
jgi:hypothetical protein